MKSIVQATMMTQAADAYLRGAKQEQAVLSPQDSPDARAYDRALDGARGYPVDQVLPPGSTSAMEKKHEDKPDDEDSFRSFVLKTLAKLDETGEDDDETGEDDDYTFYKLLDIQFDETLTDWKTNLSCSEEEKDKLRTIFNQEWASRFYNNIHIHQTEFEIWNKYLTSIRQDDSLQFEAFVHFWFAKYVADPHAFISSHCIAEANFHTIAKYVGYHWMDAKDAVDELPDDLKFEMKRIYAGIWFSHKWKNFESGALKTLEDILKELGHTCHIGTENTNHDQVCQNRTETNQSGDCLGHLIAADQPMVKQVYRDSLRRWICMRTITQDKIKKAITQETKNSDYPTIEMCRDALKDLEKQEADDKKKQQKEEAKKKALVEQAISLKVSEQTIQEARQSADPITALKVLINRAHFAAITKALATKDMKASAPTIGEHLQLTDVQIEKLYEPDTIDHFEFQDISDPKLWPEGASKDDPFQQRNRVVFVAWVENSKVHYFWTWAESLLHLAANPVNRKPINPVNRKPINLKENARTKISNMSPYSFAVFDSDKGEVSTIPYYVSEEEDKKKAQKEAEAKKKQEEEDKKKEADAAKKQQEEEAKRKAADAAKKQKEEEAKKEAAARKEKQAADDKKKQEAKQEAQKIVKGLEPASVATVVTQVDALKLLKLETDTQNEIIEMTTNIFRAKLEQFFKDNTADKFLDFKF